MSSKRSSPGWGVRTAQRFKGEDGKMRFFEGGRSYKLPKACGVQMQSQKRTSPQFSFGETTRDKLQKVKRQRIL